jgi:hypothetical protein
VQSLRGNAADAFSGFLILAHGDAFHGWLRLG